MVRIGDQVSNTIILYIGVPQGCVLSPALFTLFTHDCTPIHASNTIVKFADDTTLVGLIQDNDETAYRQEIQHLVEWCRENDLILNMAKTKEIIVDYRRSRKINHCPVYIVGEEVERVDTIKILGVHFTRKLSWSQNTFFL